MFAGTRAGDKDEDISLLSDIKRVRPGDLIIFYIEATVENEGGFYGVFRVAKQEPLVFHTRGKNALEPDLNEHKLIYRTLFEPFEVYPLGIPEWEALDKLPLYSAEIQWTLIYRKLKGKRGCTPILPWETEQLIEMIRAKNKGKPIAEGTYKKGLSWDVDKRQIGVSEKRESYPYDRKFSYDVIKEITSKQKSKHAYETHLQLYFTENIGIDPKLKAVVGSDPSWFGNEVACGVGMRKMDILSITGTGKAREFRLIEFKDEAVIPGITRQLRKYVNWASQDIGKHLIGAYSWNIRPVVVAPPFNRRNWDSVQDAFKSFNAESVSLPIQYFEFSITKSKKMVFEQIEY